MRITFAERNPIVVGAIGLVATAAVVVIATQYDKVPFVSGTKSYSAYFADAGAMRTGTNVQVSGYEVGKVTGIDLDGSR
jgi:phospholipid/cholesterol/gamma-HCH transport system substrate-binding protein